MTNYTHDELTEALQAINSIIHKCEKAQEKFPEGNSHHTLLRNRLKAMYISKALIAEAIAKRAESVAVKNVSTEQFLAHLGQLHTTDLGAERVRSNLHLDIPDVIGWCKEKIQNPHSQIERRGKNWYIAVEGCEITVNALSYTIITAHKHI